MLHEGLLVDWPGEIRIKCKINTKLESKKMQDVGPIRRAAFGVMATYLSDFL